jgi:UPF0716 protein FxsA
MPKAHSLIGPTYGGIGWRPKLPGNRVGRVVHPHLVFGLLTLAFIAMPIVEIWLIFQVGGSLGAMSTIGLIVVTAVVGAALAKHQGFAVVQRVQRAMQTGEEVGLSVVEAAMVLAAAVMMLLPGFITDGIGIALLVPPIRRVFARRIVARGRQRMEHSGFVVVDFDGTRRSDDDQPPPGVIDV